MKNILLVIIQVICFQFLNAQDKIAISNALMKAYPSTSNQDGRWVYIADTGNIKMVEAPNYQRKIPKVGFVSGGFTNYLGYHVNDALCLVMVDSINGKLKMIVPAWYSDNSSELVKPIIGKPFTDTAEVTVFLKDLRRLMNFASSGKFDSVVFEGDMARYNLLIKYSKGWEIYRRFEVDLAGMKFNSLTIINPKTNDRVTLK